jgi:hypothetical protein
MCGTGNCSGGITKGARVVETEDLEGVIEVASTRDGAYEASGGRREEAVPRSVGISRDKRWISSLKFLRKKFSSVS